MAEGERAHEQHPQVDQQELYTKRWPASSLEELRAQIVERFGPFPLLFTVAMADGSPGIVYTGIRDDIGADRPDEPFRCGTLYGYVPAKGHDGCFVSRIGLPVKTPAYDEWADKIKAIEAAPEV